MKGIQDSLPLVTDGLHEDKYRKLDESMVEFNGGDSISTPTHVTRIEVKPAVEVEPLMQKTLPAVELQNGPDQIIPTDNLFTVKADGAVKIKIGEQGNASLKPISVPTLLHNAATQFPNNVALATKGEDNEWQKITYTEYESLVRTCAKAFIKLGLEKYHSVCILGFNSLQWFISDLAAIYAGGFAAGIYTTNSAEACLHCADSSRANIIVVEDQQQLNKILEIRDRLPHLKAIIQWDGKVTVDGILSWDELMQIGTNQPDTDLDNVLKTIAVNECCTLVYTSGTVGLPKAVMLSHDNLTWTSRVASEYFQLPAGSSVLVSYLPLSHIAAQIMDLYGAISVASCVYFADNNALKGSLIKTLEEVRPTVFLGVPRVWEKIHEKMVLTGSQVSGIKKSIATWAKSVGLQRNIDRMNRVDGFSLQYMLANTLIFKRVRKALGLDRCKLLISGAAPLGIDIKKYFWSLDLPIMEGFGMSETSGCHTVNFSTDFRLEGIGRTIPGCHTKISNSDSKHEGEIMLRGRNIFMGYLNDLPKTEETFHKDEWFHTGDIGTTDNENFVYITGRMKELLITAGGENIPPSPIESMIKEELPCISQAVLIGDRRKFLTVLLTLKTEWCLETGEPLDELSKQATNWCEGVGCFATTVQEIVSNKYENVYAAVKDGIDRVNMKAVSNAQRVQKFAILPKDFSLGSGELGPTMKVKRNVVVANYADLIESFY